MKYNYKVLLAIIASALTLSACTAGFDNIPPYRATEDLLQGDNVKVGAFFPQLQRNVISTHNNQFQLSQNLYGDIYSGYMATPTAFESNKNSATYSFPDNWLNQPFMNVYTNAMGAYIEVMRNINNDKSSHIYHWANILKVTSMQRLTDMWGPMPYSKVGGGSMAVPYDSQEEIYRSFFEELELAIDNLTKFVATNPGAKPMSEYDLVYGGDYAKWVKFANSLRLRLAMRIAYVAPELAKEQAEAAVSHPMGLIESNDDNAALKSVGAHSVVNQLYTMAYGYKDIRMGASFWSYLMGYEDPRLTKMYNQGKLKDETGYFALRTGLLLNSNKDSRLGYSAPNVEKETPIVWMNASEVAFLKAEAALRGWNMGGMTAEEAYEKGIELSFDQWKAGGASEYIANDVNKPKDYIDPLKASNNTKALGSVTIAWDEAASNDVKMEKIITQKWIAMYPNGQEGWSEFRRTGYPKLFPVVYNSSGGAVDTDIQIRRVPFARMEYTLNLDNVKAAAELLGGPDTGGTRLWWDIEDKKLN